MNVIFKSTEDVKLDATNVVWLQSINAATYDVLRPTEIKEETFDDMLNTFEEGEPTCDIQIKPEVSDLEYDSTYVNDSIKLELLQDKLHLKTEIINNQEDQAANEPTSTAPPYGLHNSNLTCISNLQKPFNPGTTENNLHQLKTGKERNYSICGYVTAWTQNLVRHIKIHTGEKPFKCTVCGYASARKSSLKWHMKSHTGEKLFKCNICDYASVQKRNLEWHMMSHTGEKPFQCTICKYRSARKESFKMHMQTHTSEKPFKCSICNFAAVKKNNLEKHMKTHTREKPYKCGICDYACAEKCKLNRHMKIHTGEKLYNYSLCNYATIQNGNLKLHIETHTDENP